MSQSTEGSHLSTDDLWALLDGDLVNAKGAQAHIDQCYDCSHRLQTVRIANSAIIEVLSIPVHAAGPEPNAATGGGTLPMTPLASAAHPWFNRRRANRANLTRHLWRSVTVTGSVVALLCTLFVGIVPTPETKMASPAQMLAFNPPLTKSHQASGVNNGADSTLQQSTAVFGTDAPSHKVINGPTTTLSPQVISVKLPDGIPLTGVHVAVVAVGFILASGDTRSDGTLSLRVDSAQPQMQSTDGTVVPQLTSATVVFWKTGYQPVVVYGEPLWNGEFDIRIATVMRPLTDASAPVQLVAAGDHRIAPSASLSAQTLLTPKSAAPPTLAQVELLVLWTELQMTKPVSTANTSVN